MADNLKKSAKLTDQSHPDMLTREEGCLRTTKKMSMALL